MSVFRGTCKLEAGSHFVAMASAGDAGEHIAQMGFEQKDVVLLPVNDASLNKANEGKHWSLLVLMRVAEGNNSQCFKPFLFDSARLASHKTRAAVLVNKFLGAVPLEVG